VEAFFGASSRFSIHQMYAQTRGVMMILMTSPACGRGRVRSSGVVRVITSTVAIRRFVSRL
jgi:hypothetical protein